MGWLLPERELRFRYHQKIRIEDKQKTKTNVLTEFVWGTIKKEMLQKASPS